jgi:hypothetical protein
MGDTDEFNSSNNQLGITVYISDVPDYEIASPHSGTWPWGCSAYASEGIARCTIIPMIHEVECKNGCWLNNECIKTGAIVYPNYPFLVEGKRIYCWTDGQIHFDEEEMFTEDDEPEEEEEEHKTKIRRVKLEKDTLKKDYSSRDVRIKLADLVLKVESVKIKVDTVKRKTQRIADYYKLVNNPAQTHWTFITNKLSEVNLALDGIKVDISTSKDVATVNDLITIKNGLINVYEDFMTVIDYIIEGAVHRSNSTWEDIK